MVTLDSWGEGGDGLGLSLSPQAAPALVTPKPAVPWVTPNLTYAVSPQPHVTPTGSVHGRAQSLAHNSSSAPQPNILNS